VRPVAVLLLVPALLSCDGLNGALGNGASVDDEPMLPVQVARPPAHVLVPNPDRPRTTGLDSSRLAGAYAAADSLPLLRCLLVARHGEILAERCRNASPGRAANVKSVSKSVLSALVGVAIHEGHLDSAGQPIVPLFDEYLDGTVDATKERITIGHLLSMQSGLERTSGRNYGRWVSSPNWVRDAVRRPMVEEPGGRMLYSTGNYHLLSAILTERTGMSTLEYARSRLGEPLGVRIPAWQADPQGIYLGGNNMLLSPRAMVRFGELYRNGGVWDGRQVVPGDWVRTSLEPRTRSRWSGEAYGYGWFLGDAGGHPMFFAWGYGGQFIFVVPDLELTMVTTSDPAAPRGRRHLRTIHRILDDWIVPAAVRGSASPAQDATPG
jgi:CubicO group peptidase (beta-lactamase class C family)